MNISLLPGFPTSVSMMSSKWCRITPMDGYWDVLLCDMANFPALMGKKWLRRIMR